MHQFIENNDLIKFINSEYVKAEPIIPVIKDGIKKISKNNPVKNPIGIVSHITKI